MKLIHKFSTLFLTLFFVIVFGSMAFASQNSDTKIKSAEVKLDVVKYANQVFPEHLTSLIDSGEYADDQKSYSMGEPFTIWNCVNQNCTDCFPIWNKDKIVGIIDIEEGDELNSSFSKSFSEELESLLKQENGKNYFLLTDGNNLYSYDGIDSKVIYQIVPNNEPAHIQIPVDISNFDITLTMDDLKTKLVNNSKYKSLKLPIKLTGMPKPRSYKTLKVKGVSQSGNTCWAATCAALINFYKGKSLTDKTVAKYIYGKNWNRGATWKQIKKAYNHWGLSPTQKSRIKFTTIKSKINKRKAMHLGLANSKVGHSVGLIGYEDWTGVKGSSNSKILILLEPNGGVHKSVTLNSSGNFNYSLLGRNVWELTRIF